MLREVHTNSPRLHGSGSKKPFATSSAAQQRQPAAAFSAQQQASADAEKEPENWDAAQGADEDVFASDGEGGVGGMFGEGSQAQAAAAGVSHPLACRAIAFGASNLHPAQPAAVLGAALRRGPPPVYREEDECEMHAEVRRRCCLCCWLLLLQGCSFDAAEACWPASWNWLLRVVLRLIMHPTLRPAAHALQSSFQDVPRQPASSLVQQFFSRPAPAAPAAPAQAAARSAQQRGAAGAPVLPGDPQHASAAEAEALEQLQQEVVALQQERARVARMRLELEEAAGRLEQEKAAFEKRKVRVWGRAGVRTSEHVWPARWPAGYAACWGMNDAAL